MKGNTIIIKKKRLRNDDHAREVRSLGQKIVMWVVFGVFAIYSLTLIWPFVFLLMNSLKSTGEFFDNLHGLPKNVELINYITAFKGAKIAGSDFNIISMMGMSLFLATVGTLLTVTTSSMAAYIMAKYDFPGKQVIYSIVIFSLIVPIVGTLPSLMELMRNLGLYETPMSMLFLYSGGFGMNFLLLYSFFKGISWSYAEAAFVDGASNLRVFVQIMVPLAWGSITAIAIITFIGLWNDYTLPALLLQNMPSLAVGMQVLIKSLENKSDHPIIFAITMIAMAPIITIFTVFSGTIMKNTVVGGLKG